MVSTVTITKNEGANIARCLKSLRHAYERIVVDSGSTDDTIIKAKTAGAGVYQHAWVGYGPQKNFGAAQTHQDWVLYIDADEAVSPELWREIESSTERPKHDFYWLKIVTVFLGRPLEHLYGHNLRLFKKSAGRWSSSAVHEQVQTNSGQAIKLGGPESATLQHSLWHYSHPTVASYLATMHGYTSADAADMKRTGRHRSGRRVKPVFWLPAWLGLRQFLKLLFYRGGYRDGWPGLVWCCLSGYYEYEMGLKYLRLVK